MIDYDADDSSQCCPDEVTFNLFITAKPDGDNEYYKAVGHSFGKDNKNKIKQLILTCKLINAGKKGDI